MKFNPKARLDRSQIEDRRGQRSSGGGLPGLPSGGGGGLPGGLPVGGGIGGVVIFIIILIVASQCGGLPGGSSSSSDQSSTLDQCQSGADTEQQDCRITADVNAIQSFWTDALPQQANTGYQDVVTVPFNSSTDSGCGQATAAMGPFYCPVDTKVYLDLTFFQDMLEGQLGAQGGDFAEAYVLAHEYGHHIQDLLGTLSKNQSQQTGPTSPSVRIELQADCYAGVWAHGATTATDENGEVFILELTQDDISEAIDAATAVGDDRIQQRSGGSVNEEQWTHGSSEERVRWFSAGYESGQMSDCDTFSTNSL
ncbi:MAG: KPN_02809 family neutral zinc metallopeptidase [Nocardioidaceae bacterium]